MLGSDFMSKIGIYLFIFVLGAYQSVEAQKIGLLMGTFTSDRWFLDQKILEDQIKEAGGEVFFYRAYNAEEQMKHASMLIEQVGIDALILLASDERKAIEIVDLAKSRNVPILIYDRLVLDERVDAFVSYNSEKVGAMQASYMLEKVPQGKYMLINGPETDFNAQLFYKGQMKILGSLIEEGQIELLADKKFPNWSQLACFDFFREYFTQNLDTPNVIISANDALASSIIDALPAGLAGEILITGQDADMQGIQQILAGNQTMTIYKPIAEQATLAAKIALDLAKGKNPPNLTDYAFNGVRIKGIMLEPQVVDIDNYKETVIADGHVSLSEVVGVMGNSMEKERNKVRLLLLEKEKEVSEKGKRNLLLLYTYTSAILLVFLIYLGFSIRAKVRTNKILLVQKKDIEDKNQELSAINEELVQTQEEISSQRDAIQERNLQLEEANSIIQRQQEELNSKNLQLEKEVDERTRAILAYSKKLEEYAFTTAHNLRAPVARVLGLAQLLEIGKLDAKGFKDILSKIVQSAKELDLVFKEITGILDLEDNRSEIYEMVHLDELFDKILSKFNKETEALGVQVHYTLLYGSRVKSIPKYLESILSQLVDNAIKYRDPEKNLEIQLNSSIKKASWSIQIRDNGLGMDIEGREDQLFQMYKRFHQHIEGRGMGLFLVKAQVERLEGSIKVFSRPGVGTTFEIIFPLKT